MHVAMAVVTTLMTTPILARIYAPAARVPAVAPAGLDEPVG